MTKYVDCSHGRDFVPLGGPTTTVDDECFGTGRIDALRAVTGDTSRVYDATAPFCAEDAE